MPRYVDICEFNDSTGLFLRVRRSDLRKEFVKNSPEFKELHEEACTAEREAIAELRAVIAGMQGAFNTMREHMLDPELTNLGMGPRVILSAASAAMNELNNMADKVTT